MIEVNKIYNETNLETMLRMPYEFIDLVVTSPPYDDLRAYNGYSFEFEAVAKSLWDAIKPGGVLVWIVGDSTVKGSESGTSFKQALYFKSIGFNLHDTMIYEKKTAPLNHNRYEQDFEYMFVFSKGKPKTFNPIKIPCAYFGKDSDRTGQITGKHGEKMKRLRSQKERTNIKSEKIKGNIWRYGVGFLKSTKDREAFEHPAIFPEQLVADHINSWSNEGDLVYDPFGGSGTTAKVAHILKRNWIISEISTEYVEVATKRLEKYLKQNTLF